MVRAGRLHRTHCMYARRQWATGAQVSRGERKDLQISTDNTGLRSFPSRFARLWRLLSQVAARNTGLGIKCFVYGAGKRKRLFSHIVTRASWWCHGLFVSLKVVLYTCCLHLFTEESAVVGLGIIKEGFSRCVGWIWLSSRHPEFGQFCVADG